jgi:hypothetical protein
VSPRLRCRARPCLAATLSALAVSAALAAPPAQAAVPRLHHVFLIVGENTSYEQITARHAPFLTGTVRQGARG